MAFVVGVVAIGDSVEESLQVLQRKIQILFVQGTCHIAYCVVGGKCVGRYIVRNQGFSQSDAHFTIGYAKGVRAILLVVILYGDVSSLVISSFSLNASISADICVCNSSIVMPQMPAYSGSILAFEILFSSLNMLSCENFVIPVNCGCDF